MSGAVPPRDDLRALEGYHSPQLDVSVRLNTNESPFPPPEAFLDDWLGALRSTPMHRYPDRAAHDLRTVLGAALGQPVERLFCANGSNEVLQTLLLTYGGAGRSALVLEPTYALHAHIARVTGTAVREVPRRGDFAVDLGATVDAIRRDPPSVVFVCSPNNPTGTTEARETVVALLDAARGTGATLLVVDEAYGEFSPWSALDLVGDDGPLVVVRTYSKVWSLAALRLGFAVGPAWLVEELEKVVLPYHLSTPTQLAGLTALRFEAEMRARVEHLVAERERLRAAIDATDGVTCHPSGANFLLVRVAGDGHALWRALVERGVLVRDFSGWPGLAGCLRVTVGTAAENDAFVAALRRALPEVTGS